MWTLGGGTHESSPGEPWLVPLIGLVAALAVLVALTIRSVEGRRRRQGPRSGYS
jgi:hypothetical protein